MQIWIDLNNSPHVLFFRPLYEELRKQGHSMVITSREYAQTTQLADQLNLRHTIIGKHGGKNLKNLVEQNFIRALQLARWARPQQIDLAISHNSYPQAVAARLAGIPFVTAMDYEYQPLNHICFRLARKVIVPMAFPDHFLNKYGAGKKKARYPGLKEQVYLSDFKPDEDFREKEGLPRGKSLIVIRPPAPWTAYHRFENELFNQLLAFLNRYTEPYLLFVSRIPNQNDGVQQLENVHFAEKVYDGPQLLYHADAVISGGGTMNREAAVLGTPTYTIFGGRMGAVDRQLINSGKMTWINSIDDFQKVRLSQKKNGNTFHADMNLVQDVVNLFVS